MFFWTYVECDTWKERREEPVATNHRTPAFDVWEVHSKGSAKRPAELLPHGGPILILSEHLSSGCQIDLSGER